MSRAEELQAELDLLRLERELVRAKEEGTVTMDQKLELREARRAFRERRAGSSSVAPESIAVTAGVERIGG